ncbi:hypothetical protein FRUB_01473 [Fimbriiglobus ruber]|uniref:Uncharacterized protein n=2 Tax=Fimbriiglobus ruber TaxID=1908690 RepID=A0A225DUR5_9BACT|nr:hypothetical protein FRUB_01473 [Fimbriiglobus ruber]
MSVSVHDNWVYAHSVDYEKRRVVLYTIYPHVQPPEYTDVVFDGVVFHHFEQQKIGNGVVPANVLFDVEEADPMFTLNEYKELLARGRNHGWPGQDYDSLENLSARLTASGARCFRVSGVCGLDGFVFASSLQFLTRSSRAEVV